MTGTDYPALLRALSACGVEYIIAGGVSAVLQGAPINTFDLDIVHCRSEDNIHRMLDALVRMEAHYRMNPELRPDASHLSSPGHQLLMTRYGPLDLLGILDPGLDYTQLLDQSVLMDLSDGLRVRVLALEALIRSKESAGREKDHAVLPILRRTLEEQRRRAAPPPTQL